MVTCGSEKFWLSRDRRPPSVLASIRTYLCTYVRPPPTNKPMSNVTFTLARLTELLEREKNNKVDFFCPLNFDVYTETYNRERAAARDKKQKKGIMMEEPHDIFVAAVRN